MYLVSFLTLSFFGTPGMNHLRYLDMSGILSSTQSPHAVLGNAHPHAALAEPLLSSTWSCSLTDASPQLLRVWNTRTYRIRCPVAFGTSLERALCMRLASLTYHSDALAFRHRGSDRKMSKHLRVVVGPRRFNLRVLAPSNVRVHACRCTDRASLHLPILSCYRSVCTFWVRMNCPETSAECARRSKRAAMAWHLH